VLWLVDADRADNLRRNVQRARGLGVNVATQSPAEVRALVPAMAVDDVALGAYEPESGYADAAMTTKRLRDPGARPGRDGGPVT
jgi:glycine/D-amino acid oxidase-like deaminating enzyme